MEETELVKERLQAITDKRKLQEEISQKRLKVEEEKLKHQHLKKKALREKWLLDGINSGKEQEEMQKQNQQDQHQTKVLEQSILRLEKEIEELEKAELKISVHEEAILKKLKSVERTAEDIIKSVKVEKTEKPEETIEDIYANIPDLPKSYVPSRLRRERDEAIEEDEQNRKALYTMEIKVEKDMKTGESTVLSSIPLPSDDFKGTGVKVYDDGRKSIYAVSSNHHVAHNGTDDLAPIEVEELLRQASERNSKSPTEYHEPVYANQFCRPLTPQKEGVTPGPNIQERMHIQANGLGTSLNGSSHNLGNGLQKDNHLSPMRPIPRPRSVVQHTEDNVRTHPKMMPSWEETNVMQEECVPFSKARESTQEPTIRKSVQQCSSPNVQEDEEDIKYNVVQSMPCNVDESKPVTMIFMGYQQAEEEDEEEKKFLTGYDGIIHAELVVIDDDDEEEERETEKPSYHPVGHYSKVYQPAKPTPLPRKRSEVNPHENSSHQSPHKKSIALNDQKEILNHPIHHPNLDGQRARDETEDPSLTGALLCIKTMKSGPGSTGPMVFSKNQQ